MCLQMKAGGGVPFIVSAAGFVYRVSVRFANVGGVISARWDTRQRCRGIVSTAEGMGVLRTVKY